ncbi:FkbM family methyltransferase [Thiobacillus sp.]
MGPTITLELVDGVRVIVPDSLDLITSYVLREQEDWFEDEIKFLRHILQTGQKIIDIGANYGVYTLSMAKRVGPTGRVWAIEPASSTATLLAASIAANEYSQVVLEKYALSNVMGTAQLSLNANSELNALVHGDQPNGESEAVPLLTLDSCMESHGWKDIDFMKIDAEGEEANILRGGARFFATESPLVEYEVKAGNEMHLELVQAFAELGYDSYRLVPGLNLLAPFDARSSVDEYLLNLFCCKPDRVRQLAAKGFLIESAANDGDEINPAAKYGWRENLSELPYGEGLVGHWQKTVANGRSGAVEKGLSLYAMSRDATLAAAERFAALEASFVLLKTLCEKQPDFLRLSSLARVARDYGARQVAVRALGLLCNTIFQKRQVNPSEPFLAPVERFDTLPPGNSIADWIAAAALEELERNQSFSSFYTPQHSLERLRIIRDLGFGSAEMKRRLDLLQKRFNLP